MEMFHSHLLTVFAEVCFVISGSCYKMWGGQCQCCCLCMTQTIEDLYMTETNDGLYMAQRQKVTQQVCVMLFGRAYWPGHKEGQFCNWCVIVNPRT